MKSAKDSIRRSTSDHDESMRKASKLDPFNRSGKDRHNLYKSLSVKDSAEDDEDYIPTKRESTLDYFDDDQDN